MYIIKIFSDFTDSTNCKLTYERICNIINIKHYGENNKIYITDQDNYTHAIIINTAMPLLKNINKQNVIGLAFEPNEFLNITTEFIDYSKKYIGKYFIGEKRQLPDPFIEYFGYMWHTTPPIKEIFVKSKIMSICFSEKKCAPGHKYRHLLAKQILQNNLPIDIFGRGCMYYNDVNLQLKGEFNDVEPYDTYLFSICIENFQSNHYFSEKIMNPLLFNCTPIYIGCRNINKYFDNIILLTGDPTNDLNLCIKILREPLKYYRKTYNEKNLKTMNLIQNIENIFNN